MHISFSRRNQSVPYPNYLAVSNYMPLAGLRRKL